MWIKASASYSGTGDPIILLSSVGFIIYVMESLLPEVSSRMWHSWSPSWEGLQPQFVLCKIPVEDVPQVFTRNRNMIFLPAEVTSNCIVDVMEACPILNRQVTEMRLR